MQIVSMNYSDIPISVVLEQSQRYTKNQLRYLYEDVDISKPSIRHGIKLLYEKAENFKDEFTTTLLANKYDMFALFESDLSGLPQVTKEQTDKAFEDIYEMIKTVNPYDDDYIIRKREATIARNYEDKKRRKRLYGSHSFRTCFKETDKGVFFSIKSYLYKTRTETVRMLARALECPKDIQSKIFPELIEWCLKQPFIEQEILSILRLSPDVPPIPLEDIVDMENGKIKMVKVSISEVH